MKNSIPVSEGMVKVNNAELYYKIVGEGKPVVLLHGGPGFDHLHMLPMSELARDFKLIFYDQRATGRSKGKVGPDSITVDNFVEDLEGLRKTLKLEKMHVLGHSWGATLGLFYSIKYAENLESLILMASCPSSEYFVEYFKNFKKKILPQDSLTLRKIEQSEAFKNKELEAIQEYYRTAVKPLFYDLATANRFDLSFSENTAKNQQAVAAFLMSSLGDFDIYDKMSVIYCPTLIIHGDSDPFPLEAPLKMHKHIPQSKFVVLEKTGHFMFIESPDPLFSLIRDFLNDYDSIESST